MYTEASPITTEICVIKFDTVYGTYNQGGNS